MSVRFVQARRKGAVQGAQDGMLSGMVMGGIGGAMNPSFCFVAGTAVLTTLGKKAIEDIRVGDKIPCVDHITGEESEKRVVATSVNKTDKLVELEIGGEIIRCTETHPFQVKDKGWVDAAELVPTSLTLPKNNRRCHRHRLFAYEITASRRLPIPPWGCGGAKPPPPVLREYLHIKRRRLRQRWAYPRPADGPGDGLP